MFAALSPYVAGLVIIIWLVGAYVIPRDFIRVQRANRAVHEREVVSTPTLKLATVAPTPSTTTLATLG